MIPVSLGVAAFESPLKEQCGSLSFFNSFGAGNWAITCQITLSPGWSRDHSCLENPDRNE
jgi:hypothetical protein